MFGSHCDVRNWWSIYLYLQTGASASKTWLLIMLLSLSGNHILSFGSISGRSITRPWSSLLAVRQSVIIKWNIMLHSMTLGSCNISDESGTHEKVKENRYQNTLAYSTSNKWEMNLREWGRVEMVRWAWWTWRSWSELLKVWSPV